MAKKALFMKILFWARWFRVSGMQERNNYLVIITEHQVVIPYFGEVPVRCCMH